MNEKNGKTSKVPRIEPYLSLGLSYLRRVVNTFAYDDRCRLLKGHKSDLDYSLYDALLAQSISTYIPETIRKSLFRARRAIDDNEGPEEAWVWACEQDRRRTNGAWMNDYHAHRTLWQRGYVLWDSSRLTEWGLLDQDWRSIPGVADDISDPHRRSKERLYRDDYQERQNIWDRGGRGWWSPDDYSRISWPPGGPKELHK